MTKWIARLYPWYHLWREGWRDAMRWLPRGGLAKLKGERLAAQRVLLRQLVLPPLPQRQLRMAIDSEVAVASPFAVTQTVAGYAVTTLPDGRLQIDIAITRADWLPPGVAVYADGPAGPIPLRQPAAHPYTRWLTAFMFALLVIIAIAYLAAPLVYQRVQSLAHNRAHDELAQRTAALHYEREQLQRQVDQYQLLLADAATHADLLTALDRLSAALPDDAFLNSLRLQDGQVTIEGQAANALSLVSQLQSQPAFAGVQLLGVVQRDPQTGKDRFQIQYRPVP